MAEENGTNQGNTEEQQSGRGNQAPDNKMAETAKEIGGAAATLAEQGAKAAKKKFEEAGGVEGIKEKGRKAAGEIKAGFVPDEGTTGYRRYTSSLKNLWVSGRTGKIAIVVGIVLCFMFLNNFCSESNPSSNTSKSSSSSTRSSSNSSARVADTAPPFSTIESNCRTMTDVQFEDYAKSLVGKKVKWSGYVVDVEKAFLGDYKISITMEYPTSSGWGEGIDALQEQGMKWFPDVSFELPKNEASRLEKKQEVEFIGLISSVLDGGNKVIVKLTDVTVYQ